MSCHITVVSREPDAIAYKKDVGNIFAICPNLCQIILLVQKILLSQ